MNNGPHIIIGCLLILSATAIQNVSADKTPSKNAATPVYRPPLRGAPISRVGGASRGLQDTHL